MKRFIIEIDVDEDTIRELDSGINEPDPDNERSLVDIIAREMAWTESSAIFFHSVVGECTKRLPKKEIIKAVQAGIKDNKPFHLKDDKPHKAHCSASSVIVKPSGQIYWSAYHKNTDMRFETRGCFYSKNLEEIRKSSWFKFPDTEIQ